MLLLIALFLIIFEAIPEALRIRTLLFKKKLNLAYNIANSFEFIYRMAVALIIFAWMANIIPFHVREDSFIVMVVGYVLLRFALFDVIYNAIRDTTPLFYIGTTKWYDKFWRWFFGWTRFPEHFLILLKSISLLWGASWLLGWKDGIINIAKSIF